MAKPLVSGELREIIQPLLPAPKPRRFRNTGRKPLDGPRGSDWHSVRIEERHSPVSSTGQALVEAVQPVRGQRDRSRRRPQPLYADRAYYSRQQRQELRRRHITPSLARRGVEHGSGLGVYRWVVERTLGWLHQFRRLRVRYERRADIHEAFLSIGCSIICFRRWTSFC